MEEVQLKLREEIRIFPVNTHHKFLQGSLHKMGYHLKEEQNYKLSAMWHLQESSM